MEFAVPATPRAAYNPSMSTDAATDRFMGVHQALPANVPATMELSPASLFLHADVVVQAVVTLLLLASLWCWTVAYAKQALFRRTAAALDAFEAEFWSGVPLTELYGRFRGRADNPMASLFVAGMREADIERAAQSKTARRVRLQQVLRVQLARELAGIERYLGFLATVGSTGTFVGLFGTVWGIIHTFRSIASSNSTSLTVVAPGIAEALFATAIGLLAAIPAVIAYNRLSAASDRIADRLDGFVAEFLAILDVELGSER